MLNPDFRDILSSFDAEAVEYLVVGAYALAAHGLPRATGDLDLWVHATPDNSPRVRRALERFGAPLEGITEADLAGPDNVVQIGVSPRRIDVLTSIDGVKFAEAWPARLEVVLEGLQIPILSRASHQKQADGRTAAGLGRRATVGGSEGLISGPHAGPVAAANGVIVGAALQTSSTPRRPAAAPTRAAA